jgi:hypothetical protein
LSESFHIQHGVNQGNALSPLLFSVAINMPLERPIKTRYELSLVGDMHILKHRNFFNSFKNVDLDINKKKAK